MLPLNTDTTMKMTTGDTYPQSAEDQILTASYLALGLVKREEIDALLNPGVFSPNLYNVEELNENQQENDERTHQLELLLMDKEYADIAADHNLNGIFEELQILNTHLEAFTKQQNELKKRLNMKPVSDSGLPIHVNTHDHLVELIDMAMKLLEDCEAKVKTIMTIPHTQEHMHCLSVVLDNFQTQARKSKRIHQLAIQQRDQLNQQKEG